MSYTLRHVVVVGLLLTAACTTQTAVPATAPSEVTTTLATVREPEATATSSTPTADTPTIDEDLRTVEVLELFQDLERSRIAALNSGDRESFGDLFDETPYRDRSLEQFESLAGQELALPDIRDVRIYRDDEECLAFSYDAADVSSGFVSEGLFAVLVQDGSRWLYAYTTQEESPWLCDGSHPLDSS